jgi:two-component system, chemotaxis family, chemotaxis protein CheY
MSAPGRPKGEDRSAQHEGTPVTRAILVVDDTRSMRAMVSSVLQGAGYEVAQARDGVEALELARQRLFDLVVTDHNMPRMDGVTLVRELRKLRDYDPVALIVLSTEASPELKQKGREAGATGWMAKPFDPQRMLEIVGQFI